jgi:hypothetical protein
MGVYSSANAGLESGFNMGLRLDQLAEEKRARGVQEALNQRQADRQTALDARQTAQDERQTNLDQFGVAGKLRADVAHEGSALAQAGNLSPDATAGFEARAKQANEAYYAAAQKLLPKVQAQKQEAQNLFSDLQAGNVSLDKVPPSQFNMALTAHTGRPVSDFMPGPNGAPSVVEQGVQKLRTGVETGNEQYVLDGANTLLAPELMRGVGQKSPHGGNIVAKRIIKFVPAPSDPNNPNDPNKGKVVPILRVFVGDSPDEAQVHPDAGAGEAQKMASNEAQRYNAPPGATGHYDAPVTQNRSTDPDDPVVHLDMDQAMDRAMRLGSISSMMRNPQFAKYVDAGAKEAAPQADAFLRAAASVGSALPTRQFTTESVPLGGSTLRITRDQAGRETKREELQHTSAPVDPNKAPTLHNVIQGSQEATQQYDPATKSWVTIGKAGPRFKPGGGGGGVSDAVGGAGGAAPTAEQKSVVDYYATQSIAGDNSWQVGLARGKVGQRLIEAVKNRIPAMAAELNLSPQDVGTNKAQNVALSKTLADRQKYVTSVQQLNGTLDKQIALVESLIKKGSASGVPILNKPFNALRGALGDEDLAALDTAITGAAREHQRVLTSPMSNAQLHVSAQQTADQLLNRNQTAGQMLAVMKVMRQEAANGLTQGQETLDSVRSQLKGLGKRAPDTSSGGAAPVKVNAKGWKLMRDAQGNTAYVSPDGKSFEEAK